MVGLDLADLRRNPKLPGFGRYGAVFVRYGKSSNGSPPKRRTVFTVPEMDWLPGVLDQYVTEVRPRFGAGEHPALWVTERCGRLSRRGANDAFEAARDAAGLPAELDLHSLRHAMITHVVEFGYPERFAQDQAGHVVASTTAIYTGVSDEYRNRLLKTTLTGRYPGLWEDSRP
jgi:site-specific recombinase XerD